MDCKLQIENFKLQIAVRDSRRDCSRQRRLNLQFAICNLHFAIEPNWTKIKKTAETNEPYVDTSCDTSCDMSCGVLGTS